MVDVGVGVVVEVEVAVKVVVEAVVRVVVDVDVAVKVVVEAVVVVDVVVEVGAEVVVERRREVTPGRHEGMPAAAYHAAPGLGSTAVRMISQYSVAHYLAMRSSPAMRLGSINHCAVLEPEKFDKQYVVAPRGPCPKCPSGRQSVPGATHCHQHGGKQEAAKWTASLPEGAELITAEEREKALELAAGVRASVARSDTPKLLEGGAREVSYSAWAVVSPTGYELVGETDDPEAIIVRARVDIDYPGLCVDLKGVSRLDMLDPRRWSWRIRDYGLHVQAALYCGIVRAVTGEQPTWAWLAHQTEPPYATRLFEADPQDLADAHFGPVHQALLRWQEYQRTGDQWVGWPSERAMVQMAGGGL